MKTLKRAAALLLALAAILSLAACGGKKNDAVEYRDDLSTQQVADAVVAIRSDWSFVDIASLYENYARLAGISLEDVGEYTVLFNEAGTTADEFGILRAKDADKAAKIAELGETYLKFRLSIWMDEYMPEEKPKLENAKVKVCGQYVMYAILDEETREKAFDAFEKALKK
jgi:hypothetical protein